MEAILPDVPQVAVFDTSFHQTMPLTHTFTLCPMSIMKITGYGDMGFTGLRINMLPKKPAVTWVRI